MNSGSCCASVEDLSVGEGGAVVSGKDERELLSRGGTKNITTNDDSLAFKILMASNGVAVCIVFGWLLGASPYDW